MTDRTVPYPPGPRHVPPDLTRPGAAYRLRVVVVLGSLFVFLLAYLALVALAGLLIVWCAVRFEVAPFPSAIGLFFSVLLFAFLLKGLFTRNAPEQTLHVEVTEGEQPALFAFIRRLCEETGAPLPHRVFVSPEVNAAVLSETSLANLFVPPQRNLLIGLGLVNALNLSEFKAVLAHEFGHFSQKSMALDRYVYVANRVIAETVRGHDWIDRFLDRIKGFHAAWSFLVVCFEWCLWGVRKLMYGLFHVITIPRLSLSRQMEFHADRVAVGVAGSDAIVHALARLDFATESLNQALGELRAAADHRLYTRDLFHHHSRAAEFLRKKYRDPHRGEPRPAGAPEGAAEAGAAVGPEVRLFEPGGDGGVPPMWATHPANHLREANAKERYVPAAIDGRSPWLLFEGREELCRRVALRFYQVAAEVPDGAELADPTRVQQFIDAEHEEMTFDERYQGAYDGRPIFAGRRPAEPDEVDALFRSVERGEEWPAERLAAEHAALYAGLGERMAVYQARRRDLDALLAWANDPNAPGEIEIRGARFGKELASNLISEVEAELADDNESFAEFDRNVLLAHARMARQLGGGRLDELARRYRFQLLVQGIHQAVAAAQDQAGAATSALMAQGPEVPPELFQQAVGIYRAARQLMADRLDQAAGVPIPPLANFPSDMPLGEFLLSKPLLPDSAGLTLEAAWINKLMEQLGEVRQKSARLFFKNMGNILAFQEQLARDWHERTAPDRPGPSEAGGAAREEDLPGTIPVEDEPDGPPR